MKKGSYIIWGIAYFNYFSDINIEKLYICNKWKHLDIFLNIPGQMKETSQIVQQSWPYHYELFLKLLDIFISVFS